MTPEKAQRYLNELKHMPDYAEMSISAKELRDILERLHALEGYHSGSVIAHTALKRLTRKLRSPRESKIDKIITQLMKIKPYWLFMEKGKGT